MNKKTTLLAACIFLAAALSNRAATYTVTIPAGESRYIAIHLDSPPNTLNAIIPDVPPGTIPVDTTVHKWNTALGTFDDPATFFGPGIDWFPNLVLAPGEGVVLSNPGPGLLTLVFTGAVPPGYLPSGPFSLPLGTFWPDPPVPLPAAGLLLLGRKGPRVGTYETIVGRPPIPGSEMHRLLPPVTTYTYGAGGWTPTIPFLNVGEGAFIEGPGCPTSYTITFGPGFNLIANQLNHPLGNTLNNIMPDVPPGTIPAGTTLYKWTPGAAPGGGAFGPPAIFAAGAWAPDLVLAPGEGAALDNPGAAFALTFGGACVLCPVPTPLPAVGTALVSPKLPLVADYNNVAAYEKIVGCPPVDGAELFIWNGAAAAYDSYTFIAGFWIPPVPLVAVGRSVFIKAPPCVPPPASLLIALGVAPGAPAGPPTGAIMSWSSGTPTGFCLIGTACIGCPWTSLPGTSPLYVPFASGLVFFALACPCP